MRYIITILVFLCASVTGFAQETTHILQSGDTLTGLAQTYDTCREAIIYENDLALNGIYSAYFIIEAGTKIIIPDKSMCNSIPRDDYHTVAEGETSASLLAKYRFPMTSLYRIIETPNGETGRIWVDFDTDLNVGDQVYIMSMYPYVSSPQDLWIYEDMSEFKQSTHTLQAGDTLDALAEQYQTCREAIIWYNQLGVESENAIGYVMSVDDTLTIPPATVCDNLPYGAFTWTLEEATTQNQLIRHFQQYPQEYYAINEAQAGLLPEGTEQIIPQIQNMYLAQYDLVVETASTEESLHRVAVGDTFAQLEAQYATCAEAILYANPDLKRTSSVDPTFIIEAGTEIVIPPASMCDSIPSEAIPYTVQEDDTLWEIAYQYNMTMTALINATLDSPDSPWSSEISAYEDINTLEVGWVLTIPDSSGEFDLRYNDRLLVYEDGDNMGYVSSNMSLSETALCYGVDLWELKQTNSLDTVPFTGGSLVIDNPQHDCILRGSLLHGTIACYPEPLDNIIDLMSDAPEPLIAEPETEYCYGIRAVYEALFSNNAVLFYDSHRYRDDEDRWDLPMGMINYCFRHDKDALQNITWDTYDATVLPPDENIGVFALPEHITCTREMFEDFYVYQVRSFDTMSDIAKAYGTHPQLIAQANNISNPNLIYVGQYLLIPTPTLPHILQITAFGAGLLLAVFGLRRLMRRRTGKVKRKSKD